MKYQTGAFMVIKKKGKSVGDLLIPFVKFSLSVGIISSVSFTVTVSSLCNKY